MPAGSTPWALGVLRGTVYVMTPSLCRPGDALPATSPHPVLTCGRRRRGRHWLIRTAGPGCQTGGVRDVVILGSTGSIGTQALEVIADRPDRFRVVGLAAGGGQVELLARQVLDTEAARRSRSPQATAVQDLQLALYAEASRRGWASGKTRLPRIVAGPDAATEVGQVPVRRGAQRHHRLGRAAATLAALAAGRTLALANKESLVIGGPLVTSAPPRRVRSWPSTPSTPRWPSACAAAAPPRSTG